MERSGPETCNKTQWGEASPQYFPTERQVQTDPQWNMTTPGPRDFRKVSQSDYSAHFLGKYNMPTTLLLVSGYWVICQYTRDLQGWTICGKS